MNTVKWDTGGTGFTGKAPLGTSMDGMRSGVGSVAAALGTSMDGMASGAALLGTVKDGMVSSGAALLTPTPVKSGPEPWITGVTGMAGAWV